MNEQGPLAAAPMDASKNGADGSRIHDQGYAGYAGSLKSAHTRFLAIAVREWRQALKSRWFRRILWFAFFPLGFYGAMAAFPHLFSSFVSRSGLWSSYVEVQLLFLMLAVFFTGRRAIGEDLRTGALTLYFSRPVNLRQYLLGKWLAVAAAAAAAILGPGILLVLIRGLADADTSVFTMMGWLLSLVLVSGVSGAAGAAVMLGLSSLFGRARSAGIAWVVFFFVSSSVGLALRSYFHQDAFMAIGLREAGQHLTAVLMGGQAPNATTAACVGALALWSLLGLLVAGIRVSNWRGR